MPSGSPSLAESLRRDRATGHQHVILPAGVLHQVWRLYHLRMSTTAAYANVLQVQGFDKPDKVLGQHAVMHCRIARPAHCHAYSAACLGTTGYASL